MNSVAPLLRITGASKTFGHVIALNEVDLTIAHGEVVALVGDNGAGKSTMVKAISGTVPVDSGTIEVDGREVQIRTPHDAATAGISTVYQDLALCDNLDVVANLFLGQERRTTVVQSITRSLDDGGMQSEAARLLASVAVTIPDLRSPVSSLSGGQRQQIAVTRTLLGAPKVVLLDEPTAALGVAQTAQVLDLIRTLKGRGLGVLLISHNLADVFEVADSVAVMRLGRMVGTAPVVETSREAVVAAITGASIALRSGSRKVSK